MNTYRFYSIAAIVVIVDQLTKTIVEKTVPQNSSIAITKYFAISNIENTGAVFGFMQNNSLLFGMLTFIVIAGIVYSHDKIPQHAMAQTGFALLLGGAAGNFIDRLLFDGVTDFIDLLIWPSFNIADSALTISIITLMFYYYVYEKEEQ